jgi:ribosomal protein S18 acetylase RimI-like enzyme
LRSISLPCPQTGADREGGALCVPRATTRILQDRNDTLGTSPTRLTVRDASIAYSLGLLFVTESFRVDLAESGSPFLTSASELHARSLPSTLTSLRGQEVILSLYQYLTLRHHSVYVAVIGNHVVGGLVLLRHDAQYSSVAMFLHHPASWLKARRRIGFKLLVAQLQDLLQIRLNSKSLTTHDYILALYVDEQFRRLGLARSMVMQAASDSRQRNAGLGVDTQLENHSARALYASLGFSEFRRTKRSVILVSEAETAAYHQDTDPA